MIALPPPPTAQEIDLIWLMESKNKETIALYMQTIFALANGQVVVTYQGRRLPAKLVQIAGKSAVFEVFVS